jgi:hypothetical protein
MTALAFLWYAVLTTIRACLPGAPNEPRGPTRTRPAPMVYVAAPFAPCDGLDSAENTRRADALAQVYRAMGHRVVCVHPAILAGHFGDDADPVQRHRGQARTLAKCVGVATNGGILVVLLRPSGSPSSGTAGEIAAFLRHRTNPAAIEVWSWDAATDTPVFVRQWAPATEAA